MHKDEILRLLRSSATGYLSGAELGSRLRVSRTAVWKHIKSLERDGYVIDAVPSKGYRLTFSPDILRISDVLQGLSTQIIGRAIRYETEVVSTNVLAMEMAHRGAVEGTVVIAEQQTGGKGRLGRTWISPKGNLYCSIILRPAIPSHKAPLVTLMCAVAVVAAIRQTADISAGIKWPNDILVDGRKVGGILSEMSAEPDRVKHLVLGIGVNVNMDPGGFPPDVGKLATTLALESGAPVSRARLLRNLLLLLDHWYLRLLKNEGEVLDAWISFNVTLGQQVAVSAQGELIEGLAKDIDRDGRLIISLPDGSLRTVSAGDVTIRNG
jgi:BirA family biotin operon repressor/biotin-[acetyl-CoA-carboxylase] ligase